MHQLTTADRWINSVCETWPLLKIKLYKHEIRSIILMTKVMKTHHLLIILLRFTVVCAVEAPSLYLSAVEIYIVACYCASFLVRGPQHLPWFDDLPGGLTGSAYSHTHGYGSLQKEATRQNQQRDRHMEQSPVEI